MNDQDPQLNPQGAEVRSMLQQEEVRIGTIQSPEDVTNFAYEVLDTLPHAQELLKTIIESRKQGAEDAAAVTERAQLLRTISVEIALISGVEIEEAIHEEQRLVYKSHLKEKLASIDSEASNEEIMLELGMIRPVEGERGHVFIFPSRIFPPYIKEQWQAYVGMISQFDDATRKVEEGVITQTDFDAINQLRKRAHDTVSQSVGDILEFPDWDLEKYRRLVSKMRDEKFAEPKGELAQYARIFKDRRGESEHLVAIHRNLGRRATDTSTPQQSNTQNPGHGQAHDLAS